jgi:hypothetical protein
MFHRNVLKFKLLIQFSFTLSLVKFRGYKNSNISRSGGELLELRLLDTHLLDTFGSKSIARHKFYHLLESSRAVVIFFATVKCKSSIYFI